MTITIKALKTATIVTLYNAHAAKPVKKFLDRATAERRMEALMKEQNLVLALDGQNTPYLTDAVDPTEDTAAPAAKTGGKRGPAPQYADASRIKLLVDKNPKREGTAAHGRFSLYVSGSTVGSFLESGGTRADLSWDVAHGFISIAA